MHNRNVVLKYLAPLVYKSRNYPQAETSRVRQDARAEYDQWVSFAQLLLHVQVHFVVATARCRRGTFRIYLPRFTGILRKAFFFFPPQA